MLALGMANAYVMRTNMSVAIVAMVNHTAIAIDDASATDNVAVSECGVTIDRNSVSFCSRFFPGSHDALCGR